MTATNSPFANGLIEISAIATLIGASTATSLALGDKAAAGLPWAPISTFGIIYITKANLSAVLPDRMREALGLGGKEIEAAIGRSERLKGQCVPSRDVTEIVSIRTLRFSPFLWRKPTDENFEGELLPLGRIANEKLALVYSMDDTCRNFERVIPMSAHNTLQIHHALSRANTPIIGSPTHRYDWTILLASLVKVVEIVTLWYLDSGRLWWSSSIAWLTSFCGAFILHIFHLSRDDFSIARSDILGGQMPTPLQLGANGHVILGASGNVRHHWAWRAVWFINAISALFSLFLIFLDLPKLPSGTIHIWLAFQSVFLLARALVNHLASSASSTSFILRSESWQESSASDRRQALHLLMALAQHMITIHPRTVKHYKDALTSFEEISLKFSSCGWRLTETLYIPSSTSSTGAKESIHFMGVIPDTVLSTIAWATDKQGLDLYDSVILFTQNMAIPCVRVYTCACQDIPECRIGRGMTHDNCLLTKWMFWIPYCTKQGGEEGYLTVWTENTHGATNEFTRVDYGTLHDKLASKCYKVSITHVDEIKRILDHTREVARAMMEMFREAQEVQY